ncbi:ABC1 family-domain-containing protein [Paraphysoderma sedebokerense]|nr:ABC1 family-domain-containing protein [Paraphysoderma sedebokerense]
MMSVHTTKFVGRISVVSCRDVRRFATLAVRGPAKIQTPHRINPNFERSLSITSRLSLRPRFQPKFPWKSIATITSLSTITYLYNSPPTHNFYVDAFIRSLRSIVTGFVCVVDYKWSLRNKESISEEEYLKVKSECHTRSAKRLLSTFMKNGGVYVKLGQHIAALAYLLPLEYVETMKVLQDRCDPTATEDLEKLFQNDLGKSIDDLFIYFNPIPIGVASLAQVHQATLHNGQEVAVKIQHPHLQIFATIDIATCSGLVNLIRFLFPEFEFGWLADEMKDNLPKELDFEHESGNAGRVQMNFDKSSGRHHLNLKIPEVMWAYKRVLCMEFAKGGRIDDLEYYRRHHINPAQVSSELTSIFSSMIFLHGFVHADPHPGNLLIQPLPAPSFGYYILHPLAFIHDLIIPRKNFMIVLLDHGLYRTIDDQFRLGYAKLWRSLIRSNEKEIRYFSKQVANVDMYQLFSCMLTGRVLALHYMHI